MIPRIITAIRALVGGRVSGATDSYEPIFWDGQEPPSKSDIDKKLIELTTEYDTKQYQRDRVYPSIGEQLDLQYWDKKNSTKNWEEAIDKVKEDHPKG